MNIGDNIRKARKALNMSQEDLTDKTGSNRVTISKYETGRFLPSISALERLAKALQTTTGKLTGSEQEKDPNLNKTDCQPMDQTLLPPALTSKHYHKNMRNYSIATLTAY